MPGRWEKDAAEIRAIARKADTSADFDALLDLAANRRCVLIGEASHGTHDFYELRAELTRRLITERGFRSVGWEADWPDASRVHRFVTGRGSDPSADAALADFVRFPSWMWRNTVVRDFLTWLHQHNSREPDPTRRAGIYGLDLYSMHASMEAVLRYLDKVDPPASSRARSRYACFEHFGSEPQAYGAATVYRGAEPCEEEAVAQLVELQRRATELMHRDGHIAEEEFFSAEQNARLVKNAEQYYRAMFKGRHESWNLRDTHMFETLREVIEHKADGAGVVVWAHNSHLGDARATEMSERGELNLGQLVREEFGDAALLIGFSTYEGSVTAADDWGARADRKRVRRGLSGSYEELFHEVGIPRFWLNLRERSPAIEFLSEPRLQRAIGVIYHPDTERWSHYFHSTLPKQFDVMIHLDHTRALEPLERESVWDKGELPETYPSAL